MKYTIKLHLPNTNTLFSSAISPPRSSSVVDPREMENTPSATDSAELRASWGKFWREKHITEGPLVNSMAQMYVPTVFRGERKAGVEEREKVKVSEIEKRENLCSDKLNQKRSDEVRKWKK